MGNYALARHAFVRVIGSEAIVLDLRRDRYVAFPNLPVFAHEIEGWPKPSTELDSPNYGDNTSELNQLIARELVTTNSDGGHEGATVTLEPATLDCVYEWRRHNGNVSSSVSRAFRDTTRETRDWWRRFPLDERVERLRRKRGDLHPVDAVCLEDVKPLLGAFFHLRMWSYTARDNCLFDSVACCNFLCRFGVRASFVIGVAVAPFLAHGWAQIGTHALNESWSRARTFEPIFIA
jgi:hypothetical protein